MLDVFRIIPGYLFIKNCDGTYNDCSDYFVSLTGINKKEIIGKTDTQIFSSENALIFQENDQYIFESKETVSREIEVKLPNGKVIYLILKKFIRQEPANTPIKLIAICEDITHIKHRELNLNQFLNDAMHSVPGSLYWKNKAGMYVKCNEFPVHKKFSSKDMVGKTDEELWPKYAEELAKHDHLVITTGQTIRKEETVKVGGKVLYYIAEKSPWRNAEGEIIGVVGNSIDITAEKEAEHLQQDNKVKEAKLQEQQKFKKIVSQAVHDIRSPVASLNMLVGSCKDIAEPVRIALRDAANSINGIAEHLLTHWKSECHNKNDIHQEQSSEPILVSLALLDVLTSKYYQYQNLSIVFKHDFNPASWFVCIEMNVSLFKRMISNLINNAVAACANQATEIKVMLDIDQNSQVRIIISDQGKGIPADVLEKIRNNISVTSGKADGYGLGLTQVQDTLKKWEGAFHIDSIVGKGATVTLTLPQTKTANWLAESIQFNKDDIIVILDDYDPIHSAWEAHFAHYALTNKVVHFTNGQEAIRYLNHVEDKNKLFLLTDYELLKQPCNGLDVIKETGVSRAVLVTSHYAKKDIRERSLNLGAKVLPKQLVSEVPIVINEQSNETESAQEVDVVILDDDQMFTNIYSSCLTEKGKIVAAHNDAHEFLRKYSSYNKNAKILLDFNLSCNVTGLDIAKRLYETGYRDLYLISGNVSFPNDVPDYVNVVCKTDITQIEI